MFCSHAHSQFIAPDMLSEYVVSDNIDTLSSNVVFSIFINKQRSRVVRIVNRTDCVVSSALA